MDSYASTQAVLYLNAPEEIMLERLMERGKTSGREDDNAESIKKRYVTHPPTPLPQQLFQTACFSSTQSNPPTHPPTHPQLQDLPGQHHAYY